MRLLSAAISGVLFAIGLSISGMTQPTKVQGFLDVFGNWDPSLAFVMGGAVLANIVLFRFVLKRPNPLAGDRFDLPTSKSIDRKLVIGSAIFGIGWGMGGFCPGPALTSLGSFDSGNVLFVGAMIAGVLIHKSIFNKT